MCATCLTTTWHNGYWQQDMPRTHMAKSFLVRVELRFVLLRNYMLSRACIVRWRNITNQGMKLLLGVPSHQKAIIKDWESKLFLPLCDAASACILDCSGIVRSRNGNRRYADTYRILAAVFPSFFILGSLGRDWRSFRNRSSSGR